MHTFKGSQGTVFNYNSDGTGEVLITGEVILGGNKIKKQFKTHALDLLEFVAEIIRHEKISKIEKADPFELLNL